MPRRGSSFRHPPSPRVRAVECPRRTNPASPPLREPRSTKSRWALTGFVDRAILATRDRFGPVSYSVFMHARLGRFWLRSGPRIHAASLLVFSAVAGCSDSTSPPRPAQIEVSASTTRLTALGETTMVSATVFDQRGQEMPGIPVTWSTNPPQVAQVDPSGLVTAVGRGNVVVTASALPAAGSLQVVVQQLSDD
jgi:hypothetical protein